MSQLSEWATEAREIAASFRLGTHLQTGEPMAAFIRKVAQVQGMAPKVMNDELSQILNELLACHKKSDWLGVADYLDFELVDWLKRFCDDAKF